MSRIPACVLLLFVALVISPARAQNNDSSQAPDGNTPQTQPTPAAVSPQSHSEANGRIQRSVTDLLSGDPILNGADIEVTVDDNDITLTGEVDNYAQHQRVLALLEQYTRWRRVVDKLKIQ